MSRGCTRIAFLVPFLYCVIANTAAAKDAVIDTVHSTLRAPHGVAIRPGANANQYEIFVADTGAGRIVKVPNDQPSKTADAITGFDSEVEGSEYSGPHGLFFIDASRLVVGSGSKPVVRLYELTDAATPQLADKSSQELPDGEVETVHGFARTQANAKVPDMLLATCTGRKWDHGLAKIPVRAGTLGELAPLAELEPLQNLGTPTAIAINDRGYVVVALKSSKDGDIRSRLTFLNPANGTVVMSVPIDLGEVSGLAYHPQTDNLYAIDAAPDNEIRGGVFRIDDASEPGKLAARAVRVASIRRPTALAFGPDGALHVTATTAPYDASAGRGSLLKLSGDFDSAP